ncbi:cytochrome C [Pelobium manganitolerans]|uniref:Cytochrome C n=1 Tax=Pelobium manganitolerans TaxID=1842495 RepID=A0A419S5N7_9SPHI|nr:cytochrome C [Pelobium manganitolerans]RKD16147.1 cytochrome C [Pelobium manganitolerans]
MKSQNEVALFIDDDIQSIGVFPTPVSFELDTTKLTDGEHILKIVSKDHTGKEGIKLVPFTVRNGPAIAIEGLKKNEVVDGVVPLMINSYGKGNQTSFILHGSETPHSIPIWIVILIILFIGWAAFFHITSSAVSLF